MSKNLSSSFQELLSGCIVLHEGRPCQEHRLKTQGWQRYWISSIPKDKNIVNDKYIGTLILRIYWIYQRYISGYFDIKYR